jgi:hypothetical protein
LGPEAFQRDSQSWSAGLTLDATAFQLGERVTAEAGRATFAPDYDLETGRQGVAWTTYIFDASAATSNLHSLLLGWTTPAVGA